MYLYSVACRCGAVVILERCMQNGTSVPLHATLRLTRKVRVLDRYGNFRDEEEHLWTHGEGPIPSSYGSQEMHRMSSRAFVPGSGSDTVATPSLATELIQCKYEVQSVVRPHSGCCGTRVIAVLPITVVATPFQEPDFLEPSKPSDWNPQVFDSQVLAVCALFCSCPNQVDLGVLHHVRAAVPRSSTRRQAGHDHASALRVQFQT